MSDFKKIEQPKISKEFYKQTENYIHTTKRKDFILAFISLIVVLLSMCISIYGLYRLALSMFF